MATVDNNLLSQETDSRLLADFLPHIKKNYVDVGAEKGSFARFLMAHGLHGVCFEPLPKHAPALDALARSGAAQHYAFAIDQEDGQAEFHIACDEAGNPLDYFHSLQRLEDDPRVRHRQKLAVTCRSLASLCAEGLVEEHLGVLKIDTEGNDLRVLRGLGPVRADVVICEFFTPGIYKGWEEADPVGLLREARRLGYDWWLALRRRGDAELISLCPTAFSEREWGNLFFVRAPVFEAAREAVGQRILESEERLWSTLEAQATAKRRKRWFAW